MPPCMASSNKARAPYSSRHSTMVVGRRATQPVPFCAAFLASDGVSLVCASFSLAWDSVSRIVV